MSVDWRPHRILAAGYDLAAFEAGSIDPRARTLLLVHGLGHWTQAAWDALAPQLDADVRLVAFDLPGFGRSEKPDVRYDTAFFMDVLSRVADRLAPGAFTLCGHSLGGYLAAVYAAHNPSRVEQLALIAPAGFLRAPRFVYALLATQLAQSFFMRQPGRKAIDRLLNRSVVSAASISPEIRQEAYRLADDPAVRRAFARVYTGAVADFARAEHVHAMLRRWTGPTHLIWGRHDRFIPLAALAGAQRVYPHAAVTIAEQSGHLPMVEESAVVAAALAALMG